jgi:hypothetical protein
MAVDPILASAPVSAVLPRQAGEAVDVLAALKAGTTVDAVVLAKLETGEVRLGLLGTLLDLIPNDPVAIGDALKVTVVKPGTDLSVALSRPTGTKVAGEARDGAVPAPIAAQSVTPGAARPASVQASSGNPQDVVALSSYAKQVAGDGVAAAAKGVGLPGPLAAPSSAADPAASTQARSAQAHSVLADMLPQAAARQHGRAP